MPGAPNAPEARSRYEGDALVGTVLNGKFHVHAVLANGGMGRIYRGEQIPLGRPVAIKVLHTKYTASQEDPAFQKRFFLEASILSKLQHTNIVTVFDYGRIEGLEDESYFIAMEFLHGETLHRRLRALGALAPVEAIGLVRQIARGLREAHRQGVVHRDLKPSNIMLVPEDDGHEIVKIIDFGLVKVLSDDSEELTKEGSFLGSPRYMSPEQIAHGKVDHRTDIYSLGIILYQCLCGRTPFESENSVHTLMAHLQLPVPPMRERNPALDVPEVLEAFVRRCLEKDSINRPTTMEDFLRALRDCEVSLGLTGAGAMSTAPSGQFSAGHSAPLPVAGHSSYGDPSLTSHPSLTARPSQPSGSQPGLLIAPQPPPIAPVAPAPEAPRRSPLPFVLVGAVVVLCAALVIWQLRSPAPAPNAATAAPVSAPRAYRLVIASSTPGAVVFEGAARLGPTPLTVMIDNGAVRVQPRRLEVRLDGYEPFTVDATPSDEAVRVVANLTPRAAPPAPVVAPPPIAAPAAAPRPAVARPSGRPSRPTLPHPPPDNDDIRAHR